MKVLSVSLQKGGVGKSTVTANLAAGISRIASPGERILLIDMDPQGNLTYQMLGAPEEIQNTAVELFNVDGKYKGREIVHNTRFKNIEIIPANLTLTKAELHIPQIINAHARLSAYLSEVMFMYNYVIIDCPPSLGLFTLNALIASDYVIIPVVPEKYAVMAIGQMVDTIRIARSFNEKLEIIGILPSIVDLRYRLHKATMKSLIKTFGSLVLTEYAIGTNAPLKDAANLKKTIFEYEPRATSHKQFQNLASYIYEVFRSGLNGKEGNT
jgi:chromosome partitioning protein